MEVCLGIWGARKVGSKGQTLEFGCVGLCGGEKDNTTGYPVPSQMEGSFPQVEFHI